MTPKYPRQILWWGRGDKTYSRNRIVLGLLDDLGYDIEFFHPRISKLGKLEAQLRKLNCPDYIWVPCFRHADVLSASYFAKKWNIPLIFDPLISAYQKEVFERTKWPESSNKAKKRKLWESDVFSRPDIIICDTKAHAEYFHESLSVNREKLFVVYVGAEENTFKVINKISPQKPYTILFYGSFLELQGTDVIVNAAKMAKDLPFQWILIGEGPCLKETKERAMRIKNLSFQPWMPYEQLQKQIMEADILLGVFGNTMKSDMVIPNKVFQAMASGKPLITQKATAYKGNISDHESIGWVPGGDPESLYNKICEWFENPEKLSNRGIETRALYDKYFSKSVIKLMLEDVFSATSSSR